MANDPTKDLASMEKGFEETIKMVEKWWKNYPKQ
jgi:hypothetical protein